MIPRYEEKADLLYNKFHGLCQIAMSQDKIAPCTELHHYRVHNTKYNRKKFPLLVNSILNLIPVNHAYHMQKPSFGIITDHQAGLIERYLERNPSTNKFVNFL